VRSAKPESVENNWKSRGGCLCESVDISWKKEADI
jgi:hypothetical protein